MTMTASAVLSLLRRGKVLAASVAADEPTNLAWVAVYPLNTAIETVRQFLENKGQATPLPNVQVYRIRRFEVDRKLIDEDASIAEPDLKKAVDYFAYGEEGLASKLKEAGVQLDQLNNPSTVDYPI
ncbi:hypothetical protein E4K66_30150 [Bradyrhizobium frederickii]|uniref:Uncharacterized protein n=1 Tax=Bradyrhizobium frederickii TaxID=2560054 RepID=A0A4Y9KXL9_9BRAD|nr:hypothetical protein [Bradyrhizobium frederickii]TFV34664.1 hypothetical protein E4K66_30150 [Bradyrhizobium frederickii]